MSTGGPSGFSMALVSFGGCCVTRGRSRIMLLWKMSRKKGKRRRASIVNIYSDRRLAFSCFSLGADAKCFFENPKPNHGLVSKEIMLCRQIVDSEPCKYLLKITEFKNICLNAFLFY